ncbi:hypothetical protein R3P93_08860 [Rhodococcus cerastii]|uniref:Uncharacterized protein n=1 Tax=Rhodococcus cerastii TaxID=908616 RepID=A0ABU4CZV1_9NOCA|nr:hypothetical protein [Rhodococcus cerastii]MDV6302666.1 hypothetical protein [Rhodococcus cerastii]
MTPADDDAILLDFPVRPRADETRTRKNVEQALAGGYAIHIASVVTIASWFAEDHPALQPLVDHTPGSKSAMIAAILEILDTCDDKDDEPLWALKHFIEQWHPGFLGRILE